MLEFAHFFAFPRVHCEVCNLLGLHFLVVVILLHDSLWCILIFIVLSFDFAQECKRISVGVFDEQFISHYSLHYFTHFIDTCCPFDIV